LERKHSLGSKLTDVLQIPDRHPRLTIVVVALSLLVIILFIMIPPASVLGKADLVGYGICHRIAERSFVVGGRQLPLCARCTGTFLGAVLGFSVFVLLRRHRASRLPPVPVLGMLIMFTGFWAFDGLNSYMTLIPGAPHLYEPQNWLRLTTGMLNGLTLICLAFPIFNFTIWREPSEERALKNIQELLAILPVVALSVLLIHAELDFLLYPLAILSSLGVLMMLTIINSMIMAVVLGREGYASSLRQALVPLTAGLALAILLLTGMILLRAYLTAKLGLPF
jgi:uncharacterized membrane protein